MDRDEKDLPASQVRNRRSLLGAFTGGFVLAGIGIFLPEWAVQEARSAQHPVTHVQQHKNKRRNKRRHQLHHRRTQRRHGNGTTRGGSFGFRGIEFRVEQSGFRPAIIAFYTDRFSIDNGSSTVLEATKTIEPGSRATFQTRYPKAFLWIQDRYVVIARNPQLGTPALTLGYGGAIDKSYGWQNGTTTFDGSMTEGQAAPALQVDGYSIHPQRLNDTDDYKVFSVSIFAPSA